MKVIVFILLRIFLLGVREAQGWSVSLSKTANYQFKNNSEFDTNVKLLHGKDGQCVKLKADGTDFALSALVSNNSCVILWDQEGCYGNNWGLKKGASIADVRTKGLRYIDGVSGCKFAQPTSNKVKLHQYNYWSFLFGSQETFTIHNGECKFVGDWWDNRASLIKSENSTDVTCYKIWEHKDCTGASFCHCGGGDLALKKIEMYESTCWNNEVSALSLCNYENE